MVLRSNTTFDAAVDDLVDLETFAETLRTEGSLLVLFVSTTGDGEHTDTIKATWIQL